MRPPVILLIVGAALLITGGIALATFTGSDKADEFRATSETDSASEEPDPETTEEETEEETESEADAQKDKQAKKAGKKTRAEKGEKKSKAERAAARGSKGGNGGNAHRSSSGASGGGGSYGAAPAGYNTPAGGASAPEQGAAGNAPRIENAPAGQGSSNTPTPGNTESDAPGAGAGDSTSNTPTPGTGIELDPPTAPHQTPTTKTPPPTSTKRPAWERVLGMFLPKEARPTRQNRKPHRSNTPRAGAGGVHGRWARRVRAQCQPPLRNLKRLP